MVCVTFAVLPKADKNLDSRLSQEKHLLDFYIGRAGKTHYLIATSVEPVELTGLDAVQMTFDERIPEDLLVFISPVKINYSLLLYRLYAGLLSNPSLISDERLSDGFTFKAGETYHSPEDNILLLKALYSGGRITHVYRKEGTVSASSNDRVFLARVGAYHLQITDILSSMKSQKKKHKLNLLSYTLKSGRISVNNIFKPKTQAIPAEWIL
ncbi:MAG: hypothetical protein KKD39_00270 [Candidatus Altiarchaeota archaeon]|nr:hypothetical protein [Candidatus Altiarchaeota archaeon]